MQQRDVMVNISQEMLLGDVEAQYGLMDFFVFFHWLAFDFVVSFDCIEDGVPHYG